MCSWYLMLFWQSATFSSLHRAILTILVKAGIDVLFCFNSVGFIAAVASHHHKNIDFVTFLKQVATHSPVSCPCFWAAGVYIPAAASPSPARDAAAPSSSGAPAAPVGAWAQVYPVGAGGKRGREKSIYGRKSTKTQRRRVETCTCTNMYANCYSCPACFLIF